MTNTFYFLMTGLMWPFLLWPIESWWPYPFVVEELAKYLSLSWFKSQRPPNSSLFSGSGWKWILLFAGGFTLTESILYLMNLLALGQPQLFWVRLLLTGAMHLETTLLIAFGLDQKKSWRWLGLGAAVGVHYFFNWALQIN